MRTRRSSRVPARSTDCVAARAPRRARGRRRATLTPTGRSRPATPRASSSVATRRRRARRLSRHRRGRRSAAGRGRNGGRRRMARSFDVAIAGLGAMGSAAAYNLARRGRRVIAFDRYAPPHAMGSSHGRTRIIREAYFEDPMYVPMIRRAYQAWEDLERVSERTLLLRTGGIMIGPELGALVTGSR